MNTRTAAVKSLMKILEQNETFDEVVDSYAKKIDNMPELTNLTAGTVKHKITLDFFIEKISSRNFKKISPPIKNILRAALYELEYLKTPDYAVINSYAEIAKKYDKNSTGFVNAILRNFLRKREEINFPDPKENPVEYVSLKYSHPAWFVEKRIREYGMEETEKICEFNNKPPVLSIRINSLKTTKAELTNLFKENNVEFTESLISEECLIMKKTGNVKNIPGYEEGFWSVQGEVSALAAKILNPQPGEKILDLCAAPGGKTVHIAELMQNTGEVIAVDLSKKRIGKIEENCKRLGITRVKSVLAEATEYTSDGKFDRILIDAPCSNTGVFGKRPDARWKRTPEDIKNLSELQLKILQNASTLLKEGGVTVYCTCSIEPEENLILVEKFLKHNKNFDFDEIQKIGIIQNETHRGHVRILQSMHNIDGFFIAKFKKTKP